jgi:hypothetical protein
MSRALVVVAFLVAGIARADVSAPPTKPKPQTKPTLRTELRHIVDANSCMEAATTASLADSARIDKRLVAAIEALAETRKGGDLAERVLRHIFTDERYYAGQLDDNIEVRGFCADRITHRARSPSDAACFPVFIGSDPCSCEWRIMFNTRSGRFFDFHIGGCA